MSEAIRLLLAVSLLSCCAQLHAGLEPGDEALLLRYTAGKGILPGVLPVGFQHQFEVGDLQEAEVFDRGVYRTLRFHVVAKLGDKVICEAHNGRGLVFAGLMDNNGAFSKAWVGRSGERPVEVKHRGNQHGQTLLHDALRVPWPMKLYSVPSTSFSEGAKFKLGATDLAVQAATFQCFGARYELLQSHGADAWFGPYWQWTAEGIVLYRVTRREKLAKAEPLLDWSKVDAKVPAAITPPAWNTPKDDWFIQPRADGSTFVLSYEAEAEYVFLNQQLNPVTDAPRTGPFGRRPVDAVSPGPFVIPPGLTLQLQPQNTDDWTQLDLLFQQAARLPVSMVLLVGAAAGDRGLKAVQAFPGLQSLDLLPLDTTITDQGFRAVAGMSKLWELSLTFMQAEKFKPIAAIKNMKTVRKLTLRAPDLTAIPEAVQGWTWLESLDYTGKDIAGVKALTGLTRLAMEHSEVSRSSADQVLSLKNLRELELHTTKLPSSVLKKLAIERLSITWDTPEDPAVLIEAAATLKSLKTLTLAVTDMKGQDVVALAGSQVTTLTVREGLPESADVAALAKLSRLVTLTLERVKGADAAALSSLAALKNLKSFTLANPVLARSRVASAELAALAKLSWLEELHIRDGAMAKLGPLGLDKFVNLRRLSLENVNIEQAVVDELAKCAKLESLSLASSLLPKGSVSKLGAVKSLKQLDLRQNFSFLAEDVEALRTALPACEIVH